MKILFVTTHPPFPPVDGVRIPAAAHLLALKAEHSVDVLLLKCPAMPYSEADYLETQKHVENMYEVQMRALPSLAAFAREALLGEPYYGRWRFDAPIPTEIASSSYDIVWCATTPATAAVATPAVRKWLKAPLYIAGTSDVFSLVLQGKLLQPNRSKKGSFVRLILKCLTTARMVLLKRAERKMIGTYDMTTVQSEREREWINRIDEKLDERLLVLPNGVESSLLEMPISRDRKTVVFVGLLTEFYRERISWFLENAWPAIKRAHPDASVTVVGRGAGETLKQYFVLNDVSYVPFVEELSDVYKDQAILVAPIFKGYGIINKVLEAMASGVLVVGDSTAYNGIPEFVDGVHGLVAEEAEDFAEQVIKCFDSQALLESVRVDARELMRKHFSWAARGEELNKRVSSL